MDHFHSHRYPADPAFRRLHFGSGAHPCAESSNPSASGNQHGINQFAYANRDSISPNHNIICNRYNRTHINHNS